MVDLARAAVRGRVHRRSPAGRVRAQYQASDNQLDSCVPARPRQTGLTLLMTLPECHERVPRSSAPNKGREFQAVLGLFPTP